MPYAFANGTGTAEDPYQVATADDLNGVRDYLDAHFIQMADIDLSGYENWEPIGTSNSFAGIYDGNGYKICNMTINKTSLTADTYLGLFAQLIDSAIVKNVNLSGTITVVGITRKRLYCGGLAGASSSTGSRQVVIQDCAIDIKITLSSIDAWGYVGGIVGDGYFKTLKRCSAVTEMDISCSYIMWTGGLVGYMESIAEVDSCKVSGNFTILSTYPYGGTKCGGITAGDGASISRSYALSTMVVTDGSATAYPEVGGIAATGSSGVVYSNCYAIGSVSILKGRTTRIGGICYNNAGISCYFNSDTWLINNGSSSPKTTTEMKQQSTYVDWDFTDVWGIDPAKNDGYPYLLWQVTDDIQPSPTPRKILPITYPAKYPMTYPN